MDIFVFIMLIAFLPVLLMLGLTVMLAANIALVGGFVCIVVWISHLFKRVKSFFIQPKVSKDTLQLKPDDIFRRHEEAYIASIKKTDKGNDK